MLLLMARALKPRPELMPAANALAVALARPEVQEALEARIHRTMLWKYSTARQHPALPHAIFIEDVAGVPARLWVQAPAEVAA